ncbi:hypothetical protein EJB05_19322 [Eragrostis curvula]|uniref:Uncharacterized protein n=1 Tax=Eragrostis curvula TaxID=38414 RepID=A0A5J9UX31_9POAL|nr:hypothetical protein EJB05_19322 [Eragrostis curvula]
MHDSIEAASAMLLRYNCPSPWSISANYGLHSEENYRRCDATQKYELLQEQKPQPVTPLPSPAAGAPSSLFSARLAAAKAKKRRTTRMRPPSFQCRA